MHESANDAKAILQLVTINTGVGNYADGHSVYLTELDIVFCIVHEDKNRNINERKFNGFFSFLFRYT